MLVITPSQAPTPIFVLETENLEPMTATQGTRRRRDNEIPKEPSAKSKSCMVRSLIEEDIDIGRSAMLGGYESKSEGKETSSKSPTGSKKPEAKEKGVEKKLEKLKEELLAELKIQIGTRTSLRISSPFVTRI